MVEAEPLLEAEEGRTSFSIQSKESLDVVRYKVDDKVEDDDDDTVPLVAPVPSSSNAHKIPRKALAKKDSAGKVVRFSTVVDKYQKLADGDEDEGNDRSFEDISDELLGDGKRSSAIEARTRELYLQ